VDYVLAQVNIGRLLAPLDAPRMADFVAALDPVNAVADAAPGFVWRLQTEDGNATALRVFAEDAEGADGGILINMSVWESVEALAAFVYGGAHIRAPASPGVVRADERGVHGLVVDTARAHPGHQRGRRPGPAPAGARPDPACVHAP